MSEPQVRRERRLARELALYRYSSAFERGDIETLETILQAASQDAELERMIYALHELDQPAEQPLALDHQGKHPPEEQSLEPTLPSLPGGSRRGQPGRLRFQMLAAVLIVAVLITSSVLLFALHRVSPGTGAHTTTPTTAVAAQGMVFVLLANGDVQAYLGVTGQVVWTYPTDGNILARYNNALIVQNHVVYVAVNTSISALNEESGRLLWQKKLPVQPLNSSPNESQMLVDADMVYVSIEHEPQSVAYALRASDGQILWQSTSTAVNPPLLTASGGIAYVAIQNADMTQTNIEALRGSDGHELWHSLSPGAVSFATVANNALYVYAFPGAVPFSGNTKLDKQILALNLGNGAVIWSSNVSYGNYTTPLAYAQGVLVIEDGDKLCAHSSADGALLWCKQPPTFKPSENTSASLAHYLIGPDKLYVAYLLQKALPLSPTQIASICKQDQTCRNRAATPGELMDIQQLGIQVETLNLQNGQLQWTSSPIVTSTDRLAQSVSLGLVQLQESTLLVAGGTPLIVALDTSNGHVLWQIAGSAHQPEVLQVAATK